MKKKSISGLIAISAIVMAMIFLGCIGPTTIYDIKEHPDKYIDKRVTIEANPGKTLGYGTVEDTYAGLSGFWIKDKKSYEPNISPLPSSIFVAYSGDLPSKTIKDKWGRKTYPSLKVTGFVRHTYRESKFWFEEDEGVFYIDGKSWEYVS